MAALVPLIVALGSHQAHGQIWFSLDKTVRSADLASGATPVNASIAQNALALAADGRSGKVWALTNSRLYRLGAFGTVEMDTPLKDLAAEGTTLLATDPRDGAVWLAESTGSAKQLVRLDSNGQPLVRMALPDTPEALTTDLDGVLWLLAKKRLYAISPNGQRLATLDLSTLFQGDPKYFAVDAANDLTWVAGAKRLIALRSTTPETRTVNIDLPFPARGLAIDAERGILWVLTEKTLAAYDALGRAVESRTLANDNITNPSAIAFEPALRVPVIAHNGGITRIGTTATPRLAIPLSKEPALMVAAPLRLSTELALNSPTHGSLIAQPMPEFVLKISQYCSGNPCALPVPAADRYRVNATLNGSSIGSLFTYQPGNEEAKFQPASRLTEGVNRFTAEVTDAFGNTSNGVVAEFTIDTVPPTITSLIPAAGFVTNKSPVVVTGVVSEPAQVTINGQTVMLNAERQFSSAVALSEGINTLSINATDPAGNTGGRALQVTLDTVAPRLLTVSPASGSTAAAAATRIAGTFDDAVSVTLTGPGGTQIVTTKDFSFDVTLANGTNTFTLSATDAAGNATTTPITLIFNPIQYDPVDAPYLSVWDAMNAALIAGDIEKAASYLTSNARQRYVPIFQALLPDFKDIIPTYSRPIRMIADAELGEYAIRRFMQADNDYEVFLIYFVKTEDGRWLIESM